MGDIPVDYWADSGGFPKRTRVTHRPDGTIQVEVPTETGDLAMIDIRRTWPNRLDVSGVDQYTFEFSGDLARLHPEGITAMVQMAFLAIRESLLLAESGARALDQLAAEL